MPKIDVFHLTSSVLIGSDSSMPGIHESELYLVSSQTKKKKETVPSNKPAGLGHCRGVKTNESLTVVNRLGNYSAGL
jgi:hypothetical protein